MTLSPATQATRHHAVLSDVIRDHMLSLMYEHGSYADLFAVMKADDEAYGEEQDELLRDTAICLA